MEIILIYTNWKRKSNLHRIIEITKQQNMLPKIIIVDNSYSDENNRFISDDTSIDILERDNTLKCWERWLVSFNYNSKYTCIMDDDLEFSRNNVIEDCYKFMENNLFVDGIGCEGVQLIKNTGYVDSNHVFPTKSNIKVSIIKGRFMFIRTSSLIGLNLEPDLTCDDIKVSSHLKIKIIPSFLYNSFFDLPQGAESLSIKHYQHIKREYSTKKYFKN